MPYKTLAYLILGAHNEHVQSVPRPPLRAVADYLIRIPADGGGRPNRAYHHHYHFVLGRNVHLLFHRAHQGSQPLLVVYKL